MNPEQLIAATTPYATWLALSALLSSVALAALGLQAWQGRAWHSVFSLFVLVFPLDVAAVVLSTLSGEDALGARAGVLLLQPLFFGMPVAVLAVAQAANGARGPARHWPGFFVQWGLSLIAIGAVVAQAIQFDPLLGLSRAAVYSVFSLLIAVSALAPDAETPARRGALALGPAAFAALLAVGELGFLGLTEVIAAINLPDVAPDLRAETLAQYRLQVVDPQWPYSLAAVALAGLGGLAGAIRLRTSPTDALVALSGGILGVAAFLGLLAIA